MDTTFDPNQFQSLTLSDFEIDSIVLITFLVQAEIEFDLEFDNVLLISKVEGSNLLKNKQLSHVKLYLWRLSFLKKYLFFVIMYFILIIMQQAAYIVIPKLIELFIDHVTLQGNTSEIAPIIYMAIVTVGIIIVTRLFYSMCQMIFVEKGTVELQYKVIDKARELGYDYFENTPTGKFMGETYQNVLEIYFIYERYLPSLVQNFFGFLFPAVMICLTGNLFFIGLAFFCYGAIIFITLNLSKRIYRNNIKLRDLTNIHYKKCMKL